MLIYYLFFIAITLFSFFEINLYKKVEYKVIFYVLSFLLILMAGLRYQTGYDIDVYELIFALVNGSNYNEFLLEPGSYLIVALLRALGFSFQVYLILYALLAIPLKVKFFEKYATYIFAALLVYFPIGFMINEMGQIRHGLAIAIILVSFHFLFQDKKKLFLLFCFIAIMFHVSAFIVIPVYFIVDKKYKANYLFLFVVVLSALLFFDSRPLFLSVLDFVPIPAIKSKATLYLYSEEFGMPLGFNFSYLLRVIIFWVMLYFRDTGRGRFKFYDKVVWLYFYGIMLYLTLNSISEFAIRTSTYFKTLDCIILPFFIGFGKTRKEKNLVWVLVVLYAYYSMYKLLSDPVSSQSFIPYKSIFFKIF